MTSDERMPATARQEDPVGVESQYFSYLAQRDWRIQQCDGCRRHVFYPRQVCPYCASLSLTWVPPRGTGQIYSVTTVPAARDGEPPRHIALIDLDEGVRLMSYVDPCPPEGLRIGDRVLARIEAIQLGSETLGVVFSKVKASDGAT